MIVQDQSEVKVIYVSDLLVGEPFRGKTSDNETSIYMVVSDKGVYSFCDLVKGTLSSYNRFMQVEEVFTKHTLVLGKIV